MSTITVSLRALVGRINRALWHRDEVMRTPRSARGRHELGDYFVLDWRLNTITDTHVDPEALARELGVLKAYEVLRDDGDAGGSAAPLAGAGGHSVP